MAEAPRPRVIRGSRARSWRTAFGAVACWLLLAKGVSLAVEPRPPSHGAGASVFTLLVLLGLLVASRRRRFPSRLALVRPLVLITGVGVAAFVTLMAWVDYGLANRPARPPVHERYRIWSTRGLVTQTTLAAAKAERNSIEAVSRALNNGAVGVEVDVFFDVELGQFVVSHDRPYVLKGGRLLMLDELLSLFRERGLLWLDWKKLRHLRDPELDLALDRLNTSTSALGIKDRVFIEGEAPLHLSAAKRAGFSTILDTHPLPERAPLASVVLDFYRAVYFLGGFTVMAGESGETHSRVYGPSALKALEHVPLFLYHVPDDDDVVRELLASDNVQAFLLRDQTRNRFRQVRPKDG